MEIYGEPLEMTLEYELTFKNYLTYLSGTTWRSSIVYFIVSGFLILLGLLLSVVNADNYESKFLLYATLFFGIYLIAIWIFIILLKVITVFISRRLIGPQTVWLENDMIKIQGNGVDKYMAVADIVSVKYHNGICIVYYRDDSHIFLPSHVFRQLNPDVKH